MYIQSPTKVVAIPKPWIGWIDWLNHTIAIQITTTRLMRDAIEYVTGETDERMMNAIMFCAKWTVPLRKK